MKKFQMYLIYLMFMYYFWKVLFEKILFHVARATVIHYVDMPMHSLHREGWQPSSLIPFTAVKI
jgi:hypothetical protein